MALKNKLHEHQSKAAVLTRGVGVDRRARSHPASKIWALQGKTPAFHVVLALQGKTPAFHVVLLKLFGNSPGR